MSLFPPTKPGQKCRVIGGRLAFNSEVHGPNQRKVVTTVHLHASKAGPEQENVWRCRAQTGELLLVHTNFNAAKAAGTVPQHVEVAEADFLECWLEVIPEDLPPPQVQATEREASA